MSQKAWVITVEPTDKSAPVKPVDSISNRKKIAQIEDYLCELYNELTGKSDDDLKSSITRVSGLVTLLEKAPYIFRAELK